MVEITEFAFMVMVISASGVMMPGPLFVANISSGIQGGVKTGIKIAVGHAIVELPLVILLGIGVFSLEAFPEFRIAISILGAIVLFIFGTLQLKTIF
ncbi:MAG: LysE family translocator, partial [Nitrosopumilus sp.]|nr:LysE family translocator [Nitrosopumilus sp.]